MVNNLFPILLESCAPSDPRRCRAGRLAVYVVANKRSTMGKGRNKVFSAPVASRPQLGPDLAALFARGLAYHMMGLIAEAQASYNQILLRNPNHFDALHRLGASEFLSGRPEVAERLIRRAVSVNPKSAAAHSDLSVVLLALHRWDAALASAENAAALNSNGIEAHFSRGNALLGLSRFDDAIVSFDRVIALNPRHVDALNNRGNALHRLGRFQEAIASYDQAVTLKPDYHLAFNNRGAAFKELRQAEDALADFDRALALAPGHADAWANRGEALVALMRYEEALASYDRALSINPKLADALLGRANVFMLTRRVGEALTACESAIAIEPGSSRALMQLGLCHGLRGDTENAIACFDRALAIKPDDEVAISNKIYYLDFSGDCGFLQHQQARSEWWHQIGSKISSPHPLRHFNDRDPARRIVLGYVSSDFKQHSAAYAVRPVLQNHDKSRFEVICYSGAPNQDDVTASFRQITDQWRDISQWSDERLADTIRTDKVDILIDLSGHSGGNRLRTFARKPAPIQVTAWGHATGTGLPTIDFLFSDPVVVPPDVRHLFAERIYDLPNAMIIEPPSPGLRSAEPPVLSNGYVTYGVFNRVSKISDAAVAVWSRILRADATARLLIKDQAIDDPSIQRWLRDRFGAHGITSDRIELMGSTPREEHLAAYRLVDICLDPFPQSGGVCTWEALHMGVPVVAKLGDGISSRLAGGILAAIEMTDWVTADDEEYSRIALRCTPDSLRTLRRDLPGQIDKRCSPVAYTAAVEQAYRTMWENYCRAPDA
jgi:predicted O-linked N-acetylglucosamine transferase (SPINDLY family)